VVLHDPQTSEEKLPRPAIRPYPLQYVQNWAMKDGTPVTIRPIRPEDEPLLVNFHQQLSEDTVRLRYFHPMKLGQRVAHERLLRVCFNDYDRELALVVDHTDPATGQHEIVAVGRLSKIPGTRDAEFAILVSDRWQNRGLGKQLLALLVTVAKDEKVSHLNADILPDNVEMQRLCRKLGFQLEQDLNDNVVRAVISPSVVAP
jgi:acetyltransferase